MEDAKKFNSIGDLKKDAYTLAFASMHDNFYNNNIQRSAMYFVNHNAGSFYHYETQYASGTTLWKSPKTGKTVMIDIEGNASY